MITFQIDIPDCAAAKGRQCQLANISNLRDSYDWEGTKGDELQVIPDLTIQVV